MNTLFDKIWDAHVVQQVEDGPTELYIDRLYCHEVTSPQAFEGLRQRGLRCFRPDHIYCMPDHNTPTHDQDKPIEDPVSRAQVDTLAKNAEEFGLTHFGMMNPKNGIIHVVGPERGLTLPGMTIVCGDSHTSTHGALGAVAFGIGTSEVEMVLASQCILQARPKTMRITVDGRLGRGVTAKDLALYMMQQMTTSGATGYFVEYAGEAVRSLTMEGRLTLCNLSIEMGARGGMVAPDEVTFEYIKGRDYAPKGEAWDKAVAYWRTLRSDDDAVYRADADLRHQPRHGHGHHAMHSHPGRHGRGGAGLVPQVDGLHGFPPRRAPVGQTDRLRLSGRLHQRPHRGLPRLCLHREGKEEGGACRGLARPRLVDGAGRNQGRGIGPDTARGRLRDTPARLLRLPGHERRQGARGQVCRVHQQPQLRPG